MDCTKSYIALAVVLVLSGCAATTPDQVETTEQAGAVESAGPQTKSTVVVPEPPPAIEPEATVKTIEPVVEDVVERVEEIVPATPSIAEVQPVVTEPVAQAIPTEPHTYLVQSIGKSASHPKHGQGASIGFAVNGKEGKEIVAVRGQPVTFKVDTGVQHDFYLTTSPSGWGAGTYTDGVEGQFIYRGTVTFEPTAATPDVLYYQCRNHKFMGGAIYVINEGDDVAKLKASLSQSAAAKTTERKLTVTEGGVKQKISYADLVLASASAKRVQDSGNAQAIATLDRAKREVAAAKTSLGAGQLDDAMRQVDEGLKLVTAASRQITTESELSGVNYRAKYEELLNSLNTYETSYERNVARAKKMGQPLKSELNSAEYQKLVNDGKALGARSDHAGAVKKLDKAQVMITSVLTSMLDSQTVVYDKNFETPKEEYDYELARLESYEELIPIAIEQKQPSEQVVNLIDGFVNKAAGIKQEGQAIASKGDYKMAIMAMQAATSNLQRALRLAGVQ